MIETLKAKSILWRRAVATELGVTEEHYTSFELMYELFNESDNYDELLYKRLKHDNDLENTISDDEYRHQISGVLLETFKLCKEVYKKIPSRMEKEFKYLSQDKCWSKYIGYLQKHQEKAVVNVVRTINASIIEVTVQTTELATELLYWNGGKIFIMNFVPELEEDIDENLTIAEA